AADALTRDGIATWLLEYRRVGEAGGGWPGTFGDAARGAAYPRTPAAGRPPALSHPGLFGPPPRGQPAPRPAAAPDPPPDTPLPASDPLGPRGVVGLAAIAELARYATGPIACNASVAALMGGSPEELPDRYRQADPVALLPLRTPVILLRGSVDDVVPV